MARTFSNSKDSDIVSITTSRDQTTKLTQLSIFNEVRQNLKTLGTANPIKQNNATYNNSFKVCSANSYGTLLDVNRGYMQRLNVCPNDCVVAGTLSVQSIDNYINATTEDDVVSLSLNVNPPSVSGYVLSSTTGGDLSWIQQSSGSGGNFSTPSNQDLDMNSHDIFNVNNIQSNGITINASPPPVVPLRAASVKPKAVTPKVITFVTDTTNTLTYDASGNLNFVVGQADITGVNSVISESTSNTLSLNAASGGTAITIAGTPNIITLDVSGSSLTYDASGNLNFIEGQADITGVNNLNVNTITFSINEDGCGEENGLLTGVNKVTSASNTDTLALLSASESSSITVEGVNSSLEQSSINLFTNYTNNWLQYDEEGNLNFLQGQADITGVNNINLTTINGAGTTGQVLTTTGTGGVQFANATATQIYFTLSAPITLALALDGVTVNQTQGFTPTGTTYFIQPGNKNSNFANVRSGLAFRNKTIVLGAVASTNKDIISSTIVCRLYNSTSASSLTNPTPCGTTTLTTSNYTGTSFVCNTNFDGLDTTPQFLHVEVEVATNDLQNGTDVIVAIYVLNYN